VSPALHAAIVELAAKLPAARAHPAPTPEPHRHDHPLAAEADIHHGRPRQAEHPVGGVEPGRGASLSAGPFSPTRSPNRTCAFQRIRLSTSPVGHSMVCVVVVRSVHGFGIFVPRYRYRVTGTDAGLKSQMTSSWGTSPAGLAR
jgi:hypothetical protein